MQMILVLSLLFASMLSLDNGLGLTPPMGWMAWEQFHCESDCGANPQTCISENLFIDMIDRLSGDGWANAGYKYVNIDDCWMGKGRDDNGELFADPNRFPHGISYLADYAHKQNVKLGIYNDYGTYTCGGYTGSEGYLLRDANTFAKWGVDMLKMDGCYSKLLDMPDAYPAMSFFLNQTNRPVMFSCSWPAYDESMDYSQLPPYCNLWRNWDDISGDWNSVVSIINKWGDSPQWISFAGPGHWNDPDQLVIGMQPNSWTKTLTQEESRSQMAIWAIVAAPLIMSNDLRNVSDWAKDILTNAEVISVDQDVLGSQGKRLTDGSVDAQVWVRSLANGDFAVAFLNRGDAPANISVEFSQFSSSRRFSVRDLWNRKDLGIFDDEFSFTNVASHDTVIFRMTPQ